MAGVLAKRGPNRLGFTRESFPRLREIEELMSRMWGDGEEWGTEMIAPAVDVSETETEVDVRMDVPGMKGEDIDIQINGNLLTISGERKEEKEEKGRTFHRIERTEGSFSRTLTLPCEVQEDNVSAKYEEGVLNICMPKAEEAKARRIKVKA
jgi:HSP20 family protein